jgi:hypothetical protein
LEEKGVNSNYHVGDIICDFWFSIHISTNCPANFIKRSTGTFKLTFPDSNGSCPSNHLCSNCNIILRPNTDNGNRSEFAFNSFAHSISTFTCDKFKRHSADTHSEYYCHYDNNNHGLADGVVDCNTIQLFKFINRDSA